MTVTQATISDRLAAFAAGFRPSDLPPAVRDDARWRLVDTVGVAVAGARMDYAEAVLGVAEDIGGTPESSLIARPGRLPMPLAGFVNAAFGHGPDYDDTHSVAMVHMSVVAVTAALAAGERTSASGAEVLIAQVLGAECGLRIAAAAPHLFHARNYHATGVAGPFAAAVAGGRLLGLGERALVHRRDDRHRRVDAHQRELRRRRRPGPRSRSRSRCTWTAPG